MESVVVESVVVESVVVEPVVVESVVVTLPVVVEEQSWPLASFIISKVAKTAIIILSSDFNICNSYMFNVFLDYKLNLKNYLKLVSFLKGKN